MLGNLQVVVVPVLALAVLGERVPRSIVLALPPVCLGVLLVSGALEDGAYGANPPRGVAFGVVTGIAYAAFLLVGLVSVGTMERAAVRSRRLERSAAGG